MRYLIVSDMHGNGDAFAAVLRKVRRKHFDATLVLGDLVGYGASPDQVVEQMSDLPGKVFTVRGNHDKVAAGIDDGRLALLGGGVAAGLHWGILGAAAGVAAAGLGTVLALTAVVLRALGLGWADYLRAVCGPAVATLAMSVWLLSLWPALPTDPLAELLSLIGLGAVGYATALAIFAPALFSRIWTLFREAMA